MKRLTMSTIATAPIYLSGGQMNLLFGADLADYFNINNLLFKGYSKADYQRTGQLPEGFYRFTVDVLHYGTNRVISNHGTTMAWIALGKPPQLKTPDEGAELGLITGMPLTFSWLPSNVGIPVAGVQYTFDLWELRIPGIAPEVVAASMPPLHTTSQPHTTLVVHPASLFLEPGLRYAWRVTAGDPMGQVPFEQAGHSVVRTFTYQSRCDSVTNFSAERQGQRGTFRWTPGGNHTSFNVEMRNPATGYFHRSQSYDNQVTFATLDFGTTYQMRVQAVCHNDPQRTSDFTEWQTINIPERKVDTTTCPNCQCGESPAPPPITNFTLRKDLQPGDIISNASGATRFILKTVTPQSDGVYKGLFWFWMEIWNVKFLCEYWDLSVNTDNVMIGGDYESVSNPQFLLDVDAAKRYVDSLANAINDLTVNTAVSDTLELDIPIESIYVDADGNIVVVSINPDGSITETVLTPNGELNNTVVKDKDGNVYAVNSETTENAEGNSNESENGGNETDVEDKPTALIDAGFLYFTVEGRSDTLMNGHSLTLLKDNPVKLKIGYKDRILYNKAYYSLDENYRKRLVIHNYWDREINISNVKWKLSTQNVKGAEFQFTPSKAGSINLEIDAGDALFVVLTDTIGGVRNDTIVSGNRIKDNKMVVTLNIVDGGILKFKPKDDDNYYKGYGFDDAEFVKLQQANAQTRDYEKLKISGMDYYVPWLGVLPNTEAEIRLEYTSKNPELDSLIVLEGNHVAIKFLPDKTKKNIEIPTSALNPNVRLEVTSTGIYMVKAYSVLKGNIKVEIGRLQVECKVFDERKIKTIRIIRVKRSNETDYASFSPAQKVKLISDINEYYKQAFIEFKLDMGNYRDTLTISKSTTQIIDDVREQVFNKIPETEENSGVYYIFICSPDPNSTTNGRGLLTGKHSIVFNNSSVTSSHELGHNLGLQHTFKDEKTNDSINGVCKLLNRSINKGSMSNIMDYGNKRCYFFKYQIDHLKDK